jgi:hypothetical protein
VLSGIAFLLLRHFLARRENHFYPGASPDRPSHPIARCPHAYCPSSVPCLLHLLPDLLLHHHRSMLLRNSLGCVPVINGPRLEPILAIPELRISSSTAQKKSADEPRIELFPIIQPLRAGFGAFFPILPPAAEPPISSHFHYSISAIVSNRQAPLQRYTFIFIFDIFILPLRL